MATTELDADTLEALEGLRFENYIRHFKIEDRRTAQLVPFVLNPVQVKLRAIIDEKLAAREPVRLIILKSRRMGVSTLIQATYAHLAFTTFRFTARTGAHHHEAASTLHGMAEQMWSYLPEPLRPEKVIGHTGRVLELETGSRLSTFTAKGGGGDGVGRSMAASAIHASEVAFYDNAATTMAALKQIVPDEPGTFVIQESTAQGIGDYFHNECLRAMNGESDYTFVFFGWFEFPDYRRRVPLGGLGELDAEEQALVANFGVDEEQLAWRRHTIANECSGSLDTFHEEYPSTWQEAFLSSGRPYFKGLSEVPTPAPRYVGELEGLPVKGGHLKLVRRPDGRITIWETWKADDRRRAVATSLLNGDLSLVEERAESGELARVFLLGDASRMETRDRLPGLDVADIRAVGVCLLVHRTRLVLRADHGPGDVGADHVLAPCMTCNDWRLDLRA